MMPEGDFVAAVVARVEVEPSLNERQTAEEVMAAPLVEVDAVDVTVVEALSPAFINAAT